MRPRLLNALSMSMCRSDMTRADEAWQAYVAGIVGRARQVVGVLNAGRAMALT